jgi:hypothetical protein
VNDLDGEVSKLADRGVNLKIRGQPEEQQWADYDTGFGDTFFQLIKR